VIWEDSEAYAKTTDGEMYSGRIHENPEGREIIFDI